MKLHLPNSLRRALLSCLAALASAAPATLASGAVASGLVTFLISQHAIAEEGNDDEGDENMIAPIDIDEAWTGATTISDTSSWESFFSDASDAAGSKLVFNTTENITLGSTDRTIASDVWIENFAIAATSSNLTFNGAVYGAGDFTVYGGGSGKAYTFTGDMSTYSGNMLLSGTSANNIRFVFSGANAKSGTGDIRMDNANQPWNSAHSVVVSNGATLNNNTIYVPKFNASGSGNIVKVNELTATYYADFDRSSSTTFQAGSSGSSTIVFYGRSGNGGASAIRVDATVTVEDHVSVTVDHTSSDNSSFALYNNATLNLENGSSWTVAEDASMTLYSGATVNVKTGSTLTINGSFENGITTSNGTDTEITNTNISMQGGTLTIAGSASTGNLTGTSGTINVNSGGTLTLNTNANYTGTLNVSGTLTLGSEPTSLTLGTVGISSGGTMNINGAASITTTNVNGTLSVNGTATIGTISQNGGALNGSGTANVTNFKITGGSNNTVALAQLNATSSADFARGSAVTFQAYSSDSDPDASPSSDIQLTTNTDSVIRINAVVTVEDHVSVTVNEGSTSLAMYDGATINLENGSQWTVATGASMVTTASTINVKNGSTLTINGSLTSGANNAIISMQGGTLKANGTVTMGQLNGTGGTVTVGANGTLTLLSSSDYTGTLTMSGGTLALNASTVLGTLSGTSGSISVASGAGLTVRNSSSVASSLTLNHDATLTVDAGLSGLTQLTVNESANLVLNGTLDLTSVTSIVGTAAEGSDKAVLYIDPTALGADSGHYGLKLTADQMRSFDLSIVLDGVHTASVIKLLDLSGITDEALKNDFLTHLDKTASGLGRNQSLQWDDNGDLIVVGDALQLVWGGGSGNWNTDTNELGWLENGETGDDSTTWFEKNDAVTFGHDGWTNNGTITVGDEGVLTNKLTITQGTWAFEGGAITSIYGIDMQGGSATIAGDVLLENSGITAAADTSLTLTSANITLHSAEISGADTLSSGQAKAQVTLAASAATTWSGALNVSGHVDLTLGGAGSITGSGINIGEGARVIAGGEGAKSLGTVKIGQGSSFVITSETGWTNATKLTGANGDGNGEKTGALVIDGIDYSLVDAPNALFQNILTNTHSIKELRLTNGTTFSQGYPGQSGQNKTARFTHLYVETGSSFTLASSSAIDGTSMTVHLAGAGSSIGGGALYGGDYGFSTAVILEDNATINTSGVISLSGTLTIAGKTLTKKGSSSLNFNNNINTSDGSYGTLKVDEGTLFFNFTDNASTAFRNFTVELAGNTTLQLANTLTYTIHGLNGTAGTVSAQNTTSPSGKLIINTENADGSSTDASSGAGISGGVSIEKQGKGKQTLTGAFNGANIEVSGGELEMSGSINASGNVSVTSGSLTVNSASVTGSVNVSGGSMIVGSGLSTSSITVGSDTVDQDAELHLSMLTLDLSSSSLTLRHSGKLVLDMASDSGQADITLGTVQIGGQAGGAAMGGGSIEWSGKANFGQSITITTLTGNGNLSIGEMSGNSALNNRELHLEDIQDYTGTITGAALATGASAEYNKVYVGTINIAKGYTSGKMALGGDAKVYANEFTKLGGGSFGFGSNVVVETRLNMQHDGSIVFDSGHHFELLNGVVLYYGADTDKNVFDLGSSIFSDFGAGDLLVNVVDVSDSILMSSGLKLGITWSESDALTQEDIAGLITLQGMTDGSKFHLDWRVENGVTYAYLVLDSYVVAETLWDAAWGRNGLENAPTMAEMGGTHELSTAETAADVFAESESTGEFNSHALQAGAAASSYLSASGSQSYVRLTVGSTHEKATVVGGRIYTTGDTADSHDLTLSSYISFAPAEAGAHLHMIVGGSSCLASEGGSSAIYGSFIGDSHIQFDGEGSSIDYIVGGNHVNNSAFVFRGNSYISVFRGNVNGSIVGGSTLTKGSNNSSVFAFDGNSSIYVYTLLTNPDSIPAISDATESATGETGVAFGAVVGGNAWIDLPSDATGAMSPTFHGNSSISIDLVNTQQKGEQEVAAGQMAGEFQKDIVGGNYTALQGSGDAERNTHFIGNSSISIMADTKLHTFTGTISGASRRATSGAGSTTFTGNTSIRIEGGRFSDAIAGGFYFDHTASGSHDSTLQGNTNVCLVDGDFWRVVGGSYSLGGDAEACEVIEGNTSVSIAGGSFSSVGTQQTQIGIIAGGSFFRNNAGSRHEHRNGNASVSISGGSFTNVHIVGGDYANFDTPSGTTPASSIVGTTSVSLSGGDVTGLIVGGSYVTDESSGGSASIQDTEVSISGGTLSAESAEHGHPALAVVAGGVLLDQQSGSNADTGNHSITVSGASDVVVSGGSITGHIVGGSYVNAADGQNTLDTNEVNITISGGSVTGNVYGGHYSENTTSPDVLILGGVRITLNGTAEVSGTIVGGSYRTATKGLSSRSQGSVSIALSGGVLGGDVYAAGWHDAESVSASAPLNTTTDSTTISIGSDFSLGSGSHIISGGYYKGDAAHDTSTVDSSLLIFNSTGGYSASAFSSAVFADFDTVEVTHDTSVRINELRSIGSGIIKTGAGALSVAKLSNETGGAFSGRITVNGGELVLEAAQDICGGLSFDLTGRIAGNAGNAYLQGAAGLTGSGSINLELNVTGDELKLGSYYLASGLNGLTLDNFEESGTLEAWLEAYNSSQDSETKKRQIELLVTGDNELILRVKRTVADEFYWEGDQYDQNGDESKVWRDNDTSNWQEMEGENDGPADQTVYFDETSGGDVLIDGAVRPTDINVVGGTYVFKQYQNGYNEQDKGLQVSTLTIGGGDASAELELQLESTGISNVNLKENGKLTLADANAISHSGTQITGIRFQGGILAFGEDEQGNLLFDTDVSAQVASYGNEEASNSTHYARVQVGASSDTGATRNDKLNVSWTKTAGSANSGVDLALQHGIEKSGVGSFTLAWSGADTSTVNGVISAVEGTLVFALQNSKATISGEGDNATVQVAEGAVVSFVADTYASFNIERSFSAAETGAEAGTVVLGQVGTDGSYTLNADNTSFNGTIELRGYDVDRVLVKQAEALGGRETTLVLGGRNIEFDSTVADSTVAAGSIEVTADTETLVGGLSKDAPNLSVVLTGKVTGAKGGVLANSDTAVYTHKLTGDVSEYEGMIVAAKSSKIVSYAAADGAEKSTWTLERHDITSGKTTLRAALAGEGSIFIDYNADTLLTGAIGDTKYGADVTLVHCSTGQELIIGTTETSKTATLDFGTGNTVRLGDAENQGVWNSASLTGSGSFILTNGILAARLTTPPAGISLSVQTSATTGTDVDMAGNAATLLSEIRIEKDGHLKGVNGRIVAGDIHVHLVFGENNFDHNNGAGDSLIQGGTGSVTVQVSDLSDFALDFTNHGLIDILKRHRDEAAYTWLHVTNGTLDLDKSFWNQLGLMVEENGDSATKLLAALGFNFSGIDGGAVRLAGSSDDVYLVLDRSDAASLAHDVVDCEGMDTYKATVVDEGQDLNISLTGKSAKTPTINNLMGMEGANLNVNKAAEAGAGDVDIVLNNELWSDASQVDGSSHVPDTAKPADSRLKMDTEFEGAINGGIGVNFHKTGGGTLAVGSADHAESGLKIQGDMFLEEGGLTLRGESTMYKFIFADDSEDKRGLTIEAGQTTIRGSIIEQAEGNSISVQDGANLTLYSSTDLKSTSISGGSLTLGDGAHAMELHLSNDAKLTHAALTLNSQATLNVGNTTGNSITGLSGKGTLSGTGGEVTLSGTADFSGSLSGRGSLIISGGSTLALENVTTELSSRWNIENCGTLSVDTTVRSARLGDVHLAANSLTTMLVNTDKETGSALYMQSFTWDEKATLLIESTGESMLVENGQVLLGHIEEGYTPGELTGLDVRVKGRAFVHYTGGVNITADGDLVLNLQEREGNAFITPGMEKNALAGAELMWEATDPKSAVWKYMAQNPDGTLARLADAVVDMFNEGKTAELNRVFAASAGASISALGSALDREVERQLNFVRNRAAMADPVNPKSALPKVHLWLTGQTGYHKLDADGLAPGFTLNSWGGSVGVDIDLTKNSVVGLAISAMYGDLKTSSADNGKGDLDTTYLSAFARMNSGAWQHTVLASVGTADATLNRTVNYGSGSYSTHGQTDGVVFGFMYELGYTFMLSKDDNMALQPVVNVQYRHANLGGYSETGSDAGLRVSDVKQDALTIGLGTRFQTLVGNKALNRNTLIEARALVKADLGDRSSTATTSLLNGGTVKGELESAKVGAVGIELGAGVSVPVTTSTTFFLDAAVELRSGYNNLSAGAGIKLDF